MEISASDLEKQLRKSFNDGRKQGIRDFSWMKNGTTYVGTTGKALKQALKEAEEDE